MTCDASREPEWGRVRPGHRVELLPPTGHHQADVKAKHESQRDKVRETVAVKRKFLESCPACEKWKFINMQNEEKAHILVSKIKRSFLLHNPIERIIGNISEITWPMGSVALSVETRQVHSNVFHCLVTDAFLVSFPNYTGKWALPKKVQTFDDILLQQGS